MEVKELKPGDVLGRYQLLMPLAKGGMGQVWAARQSGTRGFQKLVAVKTILAVDEDAGELEEMLFEEASLASQVRHPNVAQTLDLGEQDGTLYLVMEWVDGEPLDFILRTARSVGGMPIAIAVHLIIQACKGLHAAHEAKNPKGEPLGIVHRDVSPQNLLVTYSGVVKLVDFGVAKATHQTTQPTALGQVKGKFAYMSPEQVNGGNIDARADVFAMGIVLYRLTTGKHPFKSETPAATIHNILTVSPTRPSIVVPDYPAPLEEVVMKALARQKTERFGSAHEMMLALEQALPATVSANAEKNTETFLRRLFEKRIAERREALQAALRAAQGDSSQANGVGPAFPRSQSTMRAVSVESAADLSAGASRGQAVAMSLVPATRKLHWPAFAFAAVLAFGAGFMELRYVRNARTAGVPAVGAAPVAGERAAAAADIEVSPAPVAVENVAAAPSASGSAIAANASNEEGSEPRASPSASAAPKRRDRPMRRESVGLATEPAAPAAPMPRGPRSITEGPAAAPPAPRPADTAPAEGDPLNRRR